MNFKKIRQYLKDFSKALKDKRASFTTVCNYEGFTSEAFDTTKQIRGEDRGSSIIIQRVIQNMFKSIAGETLIQTGYLENNDWWKCVGDFYNFMNIPSFIIDKLQFIFNPVKCCDKGIFKFTRRDCNLNAINTFRIDFVSINIWESIN